MKLQNIYFYSLRLPTTRVKQASDCDIPVPVDDNHLD